MTLSAEARVAAKNLRRWRESPLAFARECLHFEPDAWQVEVLEAFPHDHQIAMKACKGPGKTALLGVLAWNFLATRPHPKIAATSISSDNLADGLWTEMAKWQNQSRWLQDTFTWTKTRIVCNDHPETWWMSARSWSQSADSQKQADTLAGLHADYILFVVDEVGSIPAGVLAAAEAGLSTGKEAKLVMAGNPTRVDGPLYDACTRDRHHWRVIEITGDPDDPKRSPRISIDWARGQIEKYGKDNPWVLVNVFGQFPPTSLNALLGIEDVRKAQNRYYAEPDYCFAPRILGVDVARQGDDMSVIFPRQGLVAWQPIALRNVDGPQLSGRLAQAEDKFKSDATFFDATGGWGWSAIDAHKLLGRDPIPVEFSGKPHKASYHNKRTEMWFEMAEWIKGGGALPDVPELVGELITPTYCFKGDKMLLEPKEDIKDRLGRSPDYADALALTFAAAVQPRPVFIHPSHEERSGLVHDYNPLEA